MAKPVTIIGIYACDLTFSADHLPVIGETVIGSGFRMGPGGKGSNQVIAARRAGAEVNFIGKIGNDAFGEQARAMYKEEGINTHYLLISGDYPTGTAFIYVNDKTAENAIIVSPGASGRITPQEVLAASDGIAASSILMGQLEVPLEVTWQGLKIAKQHNVTTVLNPAPATELPDDLYPLVDYFTPNETEAGDLAGLAVTDLQQAKSAADFFLGKGVKAVIITLGANGVLVKTNALCEHIPAFKVAQAVDTTGAGDAFNGGFAAALAENQDLLTAVRFGCASAGLSVTRPGCAPSMPQRHEIEQLLGQ